MRKLMMSLAGAGTALAFATPAAAQYYPAPPPYAQPYGQPYAQPYGAPYGHAYGHNNWGQVRALQVRIDAIERQINRLDRRDRIHDRTADRLRAEADRLERRLRLAARNGLSPYEANYLHARIARLEQRVRYSVAQRFGHGGYNHGYGWDRDRDHRDYRDYRYDRDRDGRDDRYEDDRGSRHDDDD